MAAGEVIGRPANIVKELMENAIDAEATEIIVSISAGGRNSIKVVDNGCGMCSEDASMAFMAHATSKIASYKDLTDNLHTNGFRGEALASIAAVATVVLKTRQEDDELGTKVVMEYGNIMEQGSEVCAKGTSIEVSNLFANVPARRRFMKSDSLEAKHCEEAFVRIALANPNVRFELWRENIKRFELDASDNTIKRINDIFGKKYEDILLNADLCKKDGSYKITGYVGVPKSAKAKDVKQMFFVNGRYIENNKMRRAVANGYERMIPSGMRVPFFLFFDINPKEVDVNVSPSKTEACFQKEEELWPAVTLAVRGALSKGAGVPTIDFENATDIPVAAPVSVPWDNEIPMPTAFVPSFCPLVPDVESNEPVQGKLFDATDIPEVKREQEKKFIQYNGSFIITITDEGLTIINQERASEKVLYERFMSHLNNGKEAEQGELFADITGEGHSYESPDEVAHRIALQKARRNGIACGQVLSELEMKALVNDLMACNKNRFTPTGEMIYQVIQPTMLEGLS